MSGQAVVSGEPSVHTLLSMRVTNEQCIMVPMRSQRPAQCSICQVGYNPSQIRARSTPMLRQEMLFNVCYRKWCSISCEPAAEPAHHVETIRARIRPSARQDAGQQLASAIRLLLPTS